MGGAKATISRCTGTKTSLTAVLCRKAVYRECSAPRGNVHVSEESRALCANRSCLQDRGNRLRKNKNNISSHVQTCFIQRAIGKTPPAPLQDGKFHSRKPWSSRSFFGLGGIFARWGPGGHAQGPDYGLLAASPDDDDDL